MIDLRAFDETVSILAKIRFSKNIKRDFLKLPKKIQDNEVLLRGLIKLDATLFEYCSERLKSKKSFVVEVIKINGAMLKFATEEFQQDENLCALVIESSISVDFFDMIPEKIRTNKNFILERIRKMESMKNMHEYHINKKISKLISYIDKDNIFQSKIGKVDMAKYISSIILKEKLENKFPEKPRQIRSKI